MPHNRPLTTSRLSITQSGFALLEALLSVLIFSIGIIGIVALQGVSVANTSQDRYRIVASSLADQLIGQMWVSDRTPATLQANFQSAGSGGTNYNSWVAQVNTQLPLAAGTPPNVSVTPVLGSTTQTQVAVQVFWTTPDGKAHNYAVTDEITQFNP